MAREVVYRKLAEITRAGFVPFIMLADFNGGPAHATNHKWATRLGANFLLPRGGATCFASGGQPSVLDFALCSRGAEKLVVAFCVDHGAPLRQHTAIRMQVRTNLLRIKARVLYLPKPLPVAGEALPNSKANLQDELFSRQLGTGPRELPGDRSP